MTKAISTEELGLPRRSTGRDAHDPDLNTWRAGVPRASRAASEGEAVRARRTNRLLRALLAGVAVFLVLSLIVATWPLGQRDDARAAATSPIPGSWLLARSLRRTRSFSCSSPVKRWLWTTRPDRSRAADALQREPAAIAVMHATARHPGRPDPMAPLSPDGHIIATGGAQTTVDLFDATTYRPLGYIDVGAETTSWGFQRGWRHARGRYGRPADRGYRRERPDHRRESVNDR